MRIVLASLLCGVLAVAGCAPVLEPPARSYVGRPCVVQFRRDALGAAAPNGIPPTTGSMNGAETSLAGTLKQTTSGFIVVTDQAKDYVIPLHSILLISFEVPTAKTP